MIYNEIPKDLKHDESLRHHPIIEYNMKIIYDNCKTFRSIRTKFLFLNFNHNIIQPNRINIFDNKNKNKTEFISNSAIIKIGQLGYHCNDLELDYKQKISRRHCVIINSKNDVWIYDLNGIDGVEINDQKIKKAFLIGVNKLVLNGIELWVNANSDKLL